MARSSNGRRVFLLGIDGLPPRTFHRFMAEGRLPRFSRLLAQATEVDVIPTLPAQTAPGWMTIASGAHPSTLGIENILLPSPGSAPNVIVNGFDRDRAQAEYLWEALDRQGLDAIVLKYPGSWPPRPGNFLQVDGAGGYADIACRFEVASSMAYVCGMPSGKNPPSQTLFPEGYQEHWRIDRPAAGGLMEIVARVPGGWRDLPRGIEPGFEFVVHVEQRGRRSHRTYYGLAYRRGAQSGVVLSRDRSAGPDDLFITLGSWSDWVYDEGASGPFAYRFKLLALDLVERRLHLYRSEGHRLDGFTRPPGLAFELVSHLGPVVEWSGTYDFMNGLVDLPTQLEIYEQHTDWLAGAIRWLGRNRRWSGFFLHWHAIEYAHHLVGASLHTEHPLHQPEVAEREMEFLGQTYALAERLLEAAEEVCDEETLLVVASDHGHDLVHTIFYVNQFLRRNQWLTIAQVDGRPMIDWSRTLAYAMFPGAIFFNVRGRWPGGIVSEHEVEALGATISEALRGLVDPRTGRHVIKLVLDRSELAAYGQWGPRAPELFFFMERGYEPASRVSVGEIPSDFELTVPGKEVTSGHGSFLPASFSARTLALFAGPGVRAGVRHPTPIYMVDLAPTLAAFLGVEPPRQCEGRAIRLGEPAVDR